MDTLTRKPDRGGDRALLDDVLDSQLVGTLSTVLDGQPWSVPMMYARVGNDILLHGSSGAGALRHLDAGAPATFTVFTIDALVVADRLFGHSANYRSAVIRGEMGRAQDPDDAAQRLTDAIIPGRSAETPPNTDKELAATLILRMPIVDGQWLAKSRTGGPGVEDTEEWTGLVPIRTVYEVPETWTGTSVPDSVRRLSNS